MVCDKYEICGLRAHIEKTFKLLRSSEISEDERRGKSILEKIFQEACCKEGRLGGNLSLGNFNNTFKMNHSPAKRFSSSGKNQPSGPETEPASDLCQSFSLVACCGRYPDCYIVKSRQNKLFKGRLLQLSLFTCTNAGDGQCIEMLLKDTDKLLEGKIEETCLLSQEPNKFKRL